jgi:hypothetical protein
VISTLDWSKAQKVEAAQSGATGDTDADTEASAEDGADDPDGPAVVDLETARWECVACGDTREIAESHLHPRRESALLSCSECDEDCFHFLC